MRNALTIARRELLAYFTSPIAYVVTAAFLAISGYLFAAILNITREATLRYLFGNLMVILLFVGPLLTMRLLAEEQRSGTIELLLTAPVRDWEVVLGKFLASLSLFLLILALTLYYPFILARFGEPDLQATAAGYLGLLLFGSSILSIGLFTSALTRNQIVAAILGVGLGLILWLVDAVGNFFGPPIAGVLDYLSLNQHFNDFTRGVVDSRDVIYYLSVVIAGIFLATRVLETRRWR